MSAAADFRAAVEAADHAGMVATLSPEIVFHSPVTFRPFEGRDAVGHVLAGVMALVFRARVGDREAEGIDLIREGPDGLIEDFTVLVRPLSALQALAEAMARELGAPPPS
jgi:hypothetical protein